MKEVSYQRKAANADTSEEADAILMKGLKEYTDRILTAVSNMPKEDFPLVVASLEYAVQMLQRTRLYRTTNTDKIVRWLKRRYMLTNTIVEIDTRGMGE